MWSLLDEVVSVIRLQADKKSLDLVTDFRLPDFYFVEGDPFRLKQVLYNLLGNAIKFTYEGSVTLSVSSEERDSGAYFTFTVADTGIGISGQDINRIFNEFEQAEGHGVENRAGAGLGLTISKALIESQGGSIHVKSEWEKGSAFTFYLRFTPVQDEAPLLENKRASVPPTGPLPKVWVIDDDRFILELCTGIFEKNQIPFVAFSSPEDVLRAPWDPEVAYIFLDIRMPGMSGMELCALLRRRIPTQVRIYALTAQVMPEERAAILAQNFDGLLMKPFMEKDLLGVIEAGAPWTDVASSGPDGESTDGASGGLIEPAEAPRAVFDESELDTRSLEIMTFGDPAQLSKVLGRFALDCRNDAADLGKALRSDDQPQVVLLTHRIAGRTAQMGARKLAADYRLAEIAWTTDQGDTRDRKRVLTGLIAQLEALVRLVEAKYSLVSAD